MNALKNECLQKLTFTKTSLYIKRQGKMKKGGEKGERKGRKRKEERKEENKKEKKVREEQGRDKKRTERWSKKE